jgi:hypothetical protein
MAGEVQIFDPPFDPMEVFADRYKLIVDFVVPGNLRRKDNGRQIVTNKKTGKPLVIKSEDALAYAQAFISLTPVEFKQKFGSKKLPLMLWANIFYQSNRSDVSIELLKDLLQKSEVVSDDRWIKTHFVFGQVDTENPRTHIKLFQIL